jgi:hypothetical protein
MNKIILLIAIFIHYNYSFSQSKKDQIVILQSRLDSIQLELDNLLLIKNNLTLYSDSITKILIEKQSNKKSIQDTNNKLEAELKYFRNKIDSSILVRELKEKELKELQNELALIIKKKNAENEVNNNEIKKENEVNNTSSNYTEKIQKSTNYSDNDIFMIAGGIYLLKKTNIIKDSYSGYDAPKKVVINFKMKNKISVYKIMSEEDYVNFKSGKVSSDNYIFYKEKKNSKLILSFRNISVDTGDFLGGGEIEIINGKANLKILSGVEAEEESYYERIN